MLRKIGEKHLPERARIDVRQARRKVEQVAEGIRLRDLLQRAIVVLLDIVGQIAPKCKL